MTAVAHSPAAPAADPRRVRTLLRADAVLCGVSGLVAALAAGPVAELLGPDVSSTVVRVVGIALVVYALDLALVTRAAERWQRPAGLVAGLGNVAWVLATAGLVVGGAFSTTGAGVAVVLAAVVGELGILQLRAGRREPVSR